MKLSPITLTGRVVRLEPLSEAHVPGLVEIGLDDEIWRYMRYGWIRSEADMLVWVQHLLQKQEAGTDLPFAVISLADGKPAGATRYMEIHLEHRNLEVGGTWYGKAYQHTLVNAESKYLLLKHAFEDLGCLRVQLKTDLRNVQSQHAIERLGAVREGVLRDHVILPDGYVRSSVFYSILASEWPVVKASLEARLNKHNTCRI